MAIYYFGYGGSSGGDGLSFATRKATHTQLISLLQVGGPHSVYMCGATGGWGSAWENTEQFLPVSNVYYSVFTDHYIRFRVATGGGPGNEIGACHAISKTGFTIEPGAGFLEFGRISEWSPIGSDIDHANGSVGHGFSARRQLNFIGCTQFRLIGNGTGIPGDPDSNFIVHGGGAWVGNYWDVNCSQYLVQGIDFNRHGTNMWDPNNVTDYGPADDGDLCVFGGDRSIITQCRFKWGGHISARYMGRRQVVKENDFDGDWTGQTTNVNAGRGAAIERSGQRCAGCYSGTTDSEGTYASPGGPVMYEGNTFRNAGSAGDEENNNSSELMANHMIVRGNYAWDGCDVVFKINMWDPNKFTAGTLSNIKIYNNTCYGNGRIVDMDNGEGGVDNVFIRCDFLNNIFDQMKGAYYEPSAGSGRANSVLRWFRFAEDIEGFANYWKGGRWDGNLVAMHLATVNNSAYASRSPLGTVPGVGYRNGALVETAFHSMDASTPNEWGPGNLNATPTYAGNVAGGVRTKAAFAPNGGAAVGNAVPHAIAANTRTNATDLEVQTGQSLRFCDGWGMSSLGFLADKIQIGSGLPVRISSCNYTNGTSITLAEARTWALNDEICWVQEDGTVCEDIGAGQTAGATIPATGVGGYIVLRGLADGSGVPISVIEELDVGNVLTKTFTGLTPGTQYYFRVRAYDQATPPNLGAYSQPRLFVATNP